jgi:hypothetical protein
MALRLEISPRRFPQFPPSPFILGEYQCSKRQEGTGKPILGKLLKIRALKENCQKPFDNNF